MKFNVSNLDTIFSNVERITGQVYQDHYAVKNAQGTTIAQVVFNPCYEMHIEIDNFPGQKQYYSSSIPCRSLSDFEGDLRRVGIDLQTRRKPIEINIESVEPLTAIKRFTENLGSPVEESQPKTGKDDFFYDQAVRSVIEANRPSIAFIQRKLRIGYNRAAQLLEAMEVDGIVSVANNSGIRTVNAIDQGGK